MKLKTGCFAALALIAGLLLLAGCITDQPDKTAISEVAAAPVFQPGAVITVTGRMVNTICLGDKHRDESIECAVKHTKMGVPVAVLEDGKPPHEAWILLTVPQIFADHMGHTVRVTGNVQSPGVMNPTRVEWENEGKWVFIL